MALLVTVMVVIMISAMAMGAIHHSGQESVGGRRTKTALDALFGASAGVELARVRIKQGVMTAFDVDLAGGIEVQSRRRSESTPQEIYAFADAPGEPGALGGGNTGLVAEGNTINNGSKIGITEEMYQVNVTATTNAGAVAEVEAKISYTGPGTGSGSASGGGY
jgi:hypothetical protein